MRLFILLLAFMVVIPTSTVIGQTTSIAKDLDMYVFPANNQTAEQQSTDEADCYKWAMEQTGYDPKNPTEVTPEQVEDGSGGEAVRGAAKGAAMGAAIGAIAGDAGTGAAIGAVAGGAGGIRQRRVHEQQAQQQSVASAEQQEQKMLDDYKKAFSACLEGKGYTIK